DSIPPLRHAIDPTFTFGPKYTFTYTNTMQQTRKHNLYYKGGLNLSANVYGLIRGANFRKGKEYLIFNDNLPQLHKVYSYFIHYTDTNNMHQNRTQHLYYKGGLNLSANVYGLIRGANYRKGKVYQIFNANFSQYIKVDSDFRHYMKLGPNSTLASRIMAGYGYSYGNSSMLPYVKQFFAGGPNGLRAFRARAIGPGSHVPENLGMDNFFADQ